MGEIVFLAIIALVGGGMFAMTYGFRENILDQSGGPGMFPRIIVILLGFSLIVRIVQIVLKKETKKPFAFVEMFKGSRLLYILATLAYMLLVRFVGYVPMTIVYLIFTILVFRSQESDEPFTAGRVALIVVTNSVVAVGVYLFFTRIVDIRLPAGFIGG